MLRSYEAKLPKNADNDVKRRKPRNRDVTSHRQLPPAYSPSPERRLAQNGSGSVMGTHSSPSRSFQSEIRNSPESSSFSPSSENIPPFCSSQDKCDSAPVTRTERAMVSKGVTSLSLSSPKLSRRHHKHDCLLTETLLSNQNKMFPMVKNVKSNSSDLIELPEQGMRRQRRPSISLPDLRNVSGCLINSGASTPDTNSDKSSSPTQTKYKNRSQDDDYDDDDNDDDDDDVFSRSYPTNSTNATQKEVLPYLRQQSHNEISLPRIDTGLLSLTGSTQCKKVSRKLLRQRKYSNSDDQLQRKVGAQS